MFDPSGRTLSERTLLTAEHREFWEKLSGWVVPTEDGGGIDIFSPLAASGGWTLGRDLLSNLHFCVTNRFLPQHRAWLSSGPSLL